MAKRHCSVCNLPGHTKASHRRNPKAADYKSDRRKKRYETAAKLAHVKYPGELGETKAQTAKRFKSLNRRLKYFLGV